MTNETTKRPYLTKLINRYLKQLDPSGTWAAVRATCNFSAEPHKDRNHKGSLNFFVPISRFEKGRIWIDEGVPGPGEKGESRQVKGVEVEGRWIGGDEDECWFDASKMHAVEHADGDRRVLVGYTPRLLERLSPEDAETLVDCGFPMPSHALHNVTSEHHHVTSEHHHVTSHHHPVTSEHHPVTSEHHPVTSELEFVETPLEEAELDQLQHEHFLLRRFFLEQQGCMQEEVNRAASRAGRF